MVEALSATTIAGTEADASVLFSSFVTGLVESSLFTTLEDCLELSDGFSKTAVDAAEPGCERAQCLSALS